MREYVPFAGLLLTWFLLGLSVGHADVVRLIGANALVQAARALCTLELSKVLSRRATASDAVWRTSRRIALKIEVVTLVACVVVVSALVAVLVALDMPLEAAMVAIVALSIPARHPFGLFVARQERIVGWPVGVAVTATIGSAIVFVFGLPWQAAALVIALRDWGGVLAKALSGRRHVPGSKATSEPLTLAEAAGATEATARRRLSYRLVKTLFAVVLGPVGNVAARTGRGAGRFDSKLSRMMPQNWTGIAVFTAICVAVAGVLILISREPLLFLVSAASLRLAALGGSALLWWRYKAAADDDDEDDDD